jgi:hypothetical protein
MKLRDVVNRRVRAAVLCLLLVAPGLAACTTAMPTGDELGEPMMSPVASVPPEDAWPRELTVRDSTFSIFQPQYERWEQGRLDGRSAVAVEDLASPSPRYGVIWFTARTEVDKEGGIVTLEDLTVSRADFPTAPDDGASYQALLQHALSDTPLTIALDRLQAEIEVDRTENAGRVVAVRNDPPRIIVSETPALLVRIDGQPALRAIAGTSLLRVINTRVLLVLDRSTGRYSLWLMNRWLTAPGLDGPWTYVSDPPAALETAKQAASREDQVDLLDDPAPDLAPLLQSGSIPTIYVSTMPAELLSVRGQPAFAPVGTASLLEVTNTDDDLFLYTPEQSYYVLLSGRWFRAKSLQGPWEFVSADRLPRDFAAIPPSHPKGDVLASVPGTPAAREAVIASDIPQTATIRRSGTKLDVHYDGAPRFQKIEGIPLQYVANASVPVIRVDASTFYALQSGVWFVGRSVTGPWTVATSVPPVIYTIPPSSVLYYVTYAHVYGSTPDVAYTGYTPGYLGEVVAPGPVVVYGTGYDYPAWVGAYWYPGPVTWGWGPFDLGFGVGFFTDFEFGFGFRHHFHHFRQANFHHFRHHELGHLNVYRHWGARARFGARPGGHFAGHLGRIGRSGIDAYAGRDGHVYRREGGQWLQHNHVGGWDGFRGPVGEHEQWHQARELGQQRFGAHRGGFAGGLHGGGGFHGGGAHVGGGFSGGGFHGGGGHGR